MGKKIKAEKYSVPQDEEAAPHEEVQIDDDPDLDDPPLSKAKMHAPFPAAASDPEAGLGDAAGLGPYSMRSRFQAGAFDEPGAFWRGLLTFLLVFPWGVVLGLSWLVNKWQLMFRPVGGYFWWCVDQLDQRLPSLVEALLWAQGLVSLALHVISVGVNLGVIWIMLENGHAAAPFIIIAFYCFCHYCMAVIMFKEQDLREQGGTYLSDVITFAWRLLDVLFFDIQLAASVVHSNRMFDGTTQLMFKGYEEARVALTALLFSLPCCILAGVNYGVFQGRNGGQLIDRLEHLGELDVLRSYEDQLYAALCFSVINALEKILRLSLVDPWLHDKGDGFPLLYVRSHAARLPPDLVRDWLFRCRVMLTDNDGRLVLKELYARYTRQVKEEEQELSDPHKAYLLRKAMHVFNTRRLHNQAGPNTPTITALVADGIKPGSKLAKMLADIVLESSHLDALSLAGNSLEDDALAAILQALRANPNVALKHLDLSGNQAAGEACGAVAHFLEGNETLVSLTLASNPVRDEGAAALAEALRLNITLYRLDLGSTAVGPEGGVALGRMLRENKVLSHLSLAGSRIGPAGVEAVAKALAKNPTSGVRHLDISHTQTNDRAAGSLANMLAANRMLERLTMTHTEVTDSGAQLLCNALQGNTTLHSIDVSDNLHMDPSWQKLLSHVVKGKPKV